MEVSMPRFLALYTMKQEDLAAFRNLPQAEQDAIDAEGVKQWQQWEERHAAAILEPGGMVGKTTRIDRDGIAAASNTICGYLIVEAETAEAAAQLFQDHPHITIFPGDAVEIMPLVT
jgi:hypothetical protein